MKLWLSASVSLLLIHPCVCFLANLTLPESPGRSLRIFVGLMGRKDGLK